MERPSVLVVEDRPSVLKVIVTILEGAYQLTTATDGTTAMARLGCGPVDVVLTDVRLPGTTGFEVLREARRLSPRTSVVMMTAYANVSDAVAAIRMGAYDYVSKPVDADEIKLVVARAAARARSPLATDLVVSGDDDHGGHPGAEPSQDVALGFHRAIEEARDRASHAYLVELLRLTGGNVTRAAARAGMTRESLHRVMRKYGLRAAHPAHPGAGGSSAEGTDLEDLAAGADQA